MKLTAEMIATIKELQENINHLSYVFTVALGKGLDKTLFIDGKINEEHFLVKMSNEAQAEYESYHRALEAMGYSTYGIKHINLH